MRLYNGLPFESEEDKKTLSNIMEKLDEFAIGEVNETYERYVFNSRDQEADESIYAYVTLLSKLAQTCNFCACLHDSVIRDRLVLGVRSKQLRKRLLQEKKLTLTKCIDICRSTEATSSRLQAILGTETEEVNKIRQRDSRVKVPRRGKSRDPKEKRKTCLFCGGEHAPKKETCPAWGTNCLNCGGGKHFANVCRKSKRPQRPHGSVKQIETSEETLVSDSDSSEIDFITSITTTVNAVNSESTPESGFAKELYTVMEIGNQAVKFQIDCGASINIITQALVSNSVITPTSKRLVMWNKTEVTPLGATRIVLRNPKNRKKYSVEFVP